MKVLRLSCAAALALLCSCATTTANRTVESDFRENGLKRAAFELNCPEDQVAVTVLNPSWASAQVGATGCNQRMVYVYSPTMGWVANSTSAPGPGPGAK